MTRILLPAESTLTGPAEHAVESPPERSRMGRLMDRVEPAGPLFAVAAPDAQVTLARGHGEGGLRYLPL